MALPASDVYLRILELGSFIQYYTHPIYAHSLDPADVQEVRTMFFNGKIDLTLIDLNRIWSGRNGLVWIASANELTQLINSHPAHKHGSVVNDALGLGITRGLGKRGASELVAVEYSGTFNATCFQPTTLDARWESQSGFYLSYKNSDNWGRSHSCSGQMNSLRERIHLKLNNLASNYLPVYIGIADMPQKDSKQLLKEAVKRWREA